MEAVVKHTGCRASLALLNVWKADVLLRPVHQASPASSSFRGSPWGPPYEAPKNEHQNANSYKGFKEKDRREFCCLAACFPGFPNIVMKMLEMETVEKHKGCRASLTLLNVREDKLPGHI